VYHSVSEKALLTFLRGGPRLALVVNLYNMLVLRLGYKMGDQ